MPKHPAQYSKEIIEALEPLLKDSPAVFDPFAGTGERLGQLCDKLQINFSGIDIEDWEGDSRILLGDATQASSYPDCEHHLVTSPTYANGMNDHFEPKDDSTRRTYRVGLGRALHDNNTGRYGIRSGSRSFDRYKELNEQAVGLWMAEKVFLNVSDFIHKNEVYPLVDWWKELMESRYKLVEEVLVHTPRYRFGDNHGARVDSESITVWELT